MAIGGLPVSDVVNVTMTLTPIAAGTRNFGALLIAGPSDVIDVRERIRQYANLEGVGTDFGTTAPEWLAADLFFSQAPQPSILYIGRWAQAATAGLLHGGDLTPAQQVTLLAALQAITDGSFKITVDGTLRTLTGLDFHLITNLNGAATVINAALTQATTTWNSIFGRFDVESHTTGTSSTLTYASTDAGVGTDISGTLKLTAATGASAPIAGIAADTPEACTNILLGPGLLNNDVYGFMFAPTNSTDISDSHHEGVAAIIEGLGTSHVYLVTTQEANVLDPTHTDDLASVLQSLKLKRTCIQYSSSSPYAIASFFGRAATVDFEGQNTTITLKFKQEPGVIAETLTETQAATADAKNCNYFVNFNITTGTGAPIAIIQQGVMCNGDFFDERHGLDWLQNDIQTDLFNALYTSPTKIPQTDAGTHILVARAEARMAQAVNNGLCAPGQWNGPPLGQINTGDILPKGFYVFAQPVATQSQADREARKSVPIQILAKLAGAIHFANVAITVNR